MTTNVHVIECSRDMYVRHKQRIASHLNVQYTVDDWRGSLARGYFVSGAALFTTCQKTLKEARKHPQLRVITIEALAEEINKAIPLTDWLDGKPSRVGEYNASSLALETVRRWWDGKNWSANWSENQSGTGHADYMASKVANVDQSEIFYRGLSQEPITLE